MFQENSSHCTLTEEAAKENSVNLVDSEILTFGRDSRGSPVGSGVKPLLILGSGRDRMKSHQEWAGAGYDSIERPACSFISVSKQSVDLVSPTQKNYTPYNPL